jgi:hypothetical protein
MTVAARALVAAGVLIAASGVLGLLGRLPGLPVGRGAHVGHLGQ